MKTIRLALLAATLAFTPAAFARDSYGFSISIGSPGYYTSSPYYYAPPPVIYHHAPPVVYYRHYSPPPRTFHSHKGWHQQNRHGHHHSRGHDKHRGHWR